MLEVDPMRTMRSMGGWIGRLPGRWDAPLHQAEPKTPAVHKAAGHFSCRTNAAWLFVFSVAAAVITTPAGPASLATFSLKQPQFRTGTPVRRPGPPSSTGKDHPRTPHRKVPWRPALSPADEA